MKNRDYITTIIVVLPDERLLPMKKLTKSFGVPPEELVWVSIEELLPRPEDTFRQTVE